MTLPATSGEKLHLLFAVLAWLVPRGGATISEIAGQFGIGERDVVGLMEMASCCGVPPYSPDCLLDLLVDGDRVEANLGEIMGRPRRLSAPEGFALAASIRAILSVPGADSDHALRSALAKLQAALGDRANVSVDIEDPPFYGVVHNAMEARHQVDIEYYSATRDEVTTRRIEPFHMFTVDGHWYADAYCHSARSIRHFRVDRIRAARDCGIPADFDAGEAMQSVAPMGDFLQGEGIVDVELDVPAEARWITETYPIRSATETEDGRIRIVLPVAGLPWLERLLLVLGPDASVVAPERYATAGRDAATRVLARYR